MALSAEWLNQCEQIPNPVLADAQWGEEVHVMREQFAEMLDENVELKEQLSTVGRWRRQHPWSLNTAELANAVRSIETEGLCWAELHWQLSMAALSGAWFEHVDSEQQSVGAAEDVCSMLENNGYQIARQELGSVLWLWQLAEGTTSPRCAQIANDLKEQLSSKRPKFWCFGPNADCQEPTQISDAISWELFVDLLSYPYILQTAAQLAILQIEEDTAAADDAIEDVYDPGDNVIYYDDDEDDEEENEQGEGVDWMTENPSPEVQRWSEMAEQYNTAPSEIAFLQSIAQLSEAHKMEAVDSPARPLLVDKLLDEILDTNSQDRSHKSASRSATPREDSHQVHLQRNLYASQFRNNEAHSSLPRSHEVEQEWDCNGRSISQNSLIDVDPWPDQEPVLEMPEWEIPKRSPVVPFARTSRRGSQKAASGTKAVRAALLAYKQPVLCGPNSASSIVQPTFMAIPEQNPGQKARAWRRRQQDITKAWSEPRRRSALSSAKRSVNNVKLVRMGEALSFLSPDKVASGSVSFDRAANTHRLPPSPISECSVHSYGDPLASNSHDGSKIAVSPQASRGGKHIGSVSRQVVYTFPQSEARRPIPDYNVGPGAYLPV